MALKQMMYSDFSGGNNDSVAAISISDKETALSENADYSAEVKALQTRKGNAKLSAEIASYGAEVTDGYAWTVGSQYKKCIVIGGIVYEINTTTGAKTEKIALTSGATKIYPFVIYDRFYFGDGSELYVWGDADHYTEEGTISVAIGDVIKNNSSSNGVKGNFYQAVVAQTSIDLTTETYTNTAKWTDVTDVRYSSSKVVKIATAYNPAAKEVVTLTITSGSSAAGTLSLTLNDVTFTYTVAASASVASIITGINALTTSGWTKKVSSNTIKFTKDTVGLSTNGYFDPSTTGVTATYVTTTEGKENDNDLSPIKKCTMFTVHTGSYRVFAAGNPDDNGLYYSEIGKPTYFVSALNKVYPANGYGRIKALIPLSDSLIVSYENGWYVWQGITPLEDATWKPFNLPYGCAANDSLVLTPYSFTFLAKEGLYTVSASILSSEAVLIQGKDIITKITENQVEKAIRSIKDMSICKGIFYNNVYYLAYNTDGVTNDRILKYEFDTKSFTFVTGWKVNGWLSDPENLYFLSKNYLLKANEGYNDIDVETGLEKPIQFHVTTKEYSFGNPLSQKVLQFIGFLFKQNNSDFSGVNINILMGYESFVVSGSESFAPGTVDLAESLVWGREWDKIWGYRESIIKMLEINRVSNTFQIDITSSNLNDPITLLGIGFIFDETDLVMPNILKDEVLLQ